MTMLAQIARALCARHEGTSDDDGGIPAWLGYMPDARAAVEAMREPGKVAMEAMWGEFPSRRSWSAAIDAILAEEG